MKGLTFNMTIPQHEWQRGLREDFQSRARQLVVDHFNNRRDSYPMHHASDRFVLTFEDTYVFWFSKTLQNWKAQVSTTVPDGMIYEITYNGDKKETYLDAYEKVVNVVIPDGPREGDGP